MADALKEMTTEIVASYVTGNNISPASLPELIAAVFKSLATIDAPAAPEAAAPDPIKLTPAQIRKSITPTGLISFEDGKTYQTLKRHLSLRGLTVDQYRAKWGLPKDYPTTSPAYTERRSALAKSMGLGRKGKGRSKAA